MLQQMHGRGLSKFARRQRGAKFIDYGLIVGVITVVALVALEVTGGSVSALLGRVNTQLEDSGSGSVGAGNGSNSPPVWVTEGTEYLAPSQGFLLRLMATDANNDPLSYSIVTGTLPDGLALSGDVISGSPTTLGTNNVIFRADDGKGGTSDQSLEFVVDEPGYRYIRVVYADSDALGSPGAYAGISQMAVFDAGGNEFPSQDMTGNAIPTPLIASASSEFSGSFQAYHGFDNSASTYWSSSNASGASQTLEVDLGDGNRVIPARIDLFGPSGQSDGRLPQNGRIEGSKNGVDYETLFTIENYTWSANSNSAPLDSPTYNDPPRWNSGLLGPFTVGVAISEELVATDPEGEAVTFSISSGSLPAGLSLSGNRIVGTPSGTASNQAVSVTATDASGAGESQSYSISVNEPSDFVLDQTTATAAAAYGTRRLTEDYSGPLFRLRNGSTNATTDIGFDGNGAMDSAAVSSHLSGANGFITTWYDQSGNTNNASMTTTGKQPRLVGTMVVFDGVDDQLLMNSNSFSNINDEMAVFAVLQSSDPDGHIVGTGSASAGFLTTYGHALYLSGSALRFKANSNNVGLNFGASTDLASEPVVVTVSERAGASSSSLLTNGSTLSSSTTAPNAHNYTVSAIGASAGSGTTADRDEYAGSIGELIIYDEALEATDSSGYTDVRLNMVDEWVP